MVSGGTLSLCRRRAEGYAPAIFILSEGEELQDCALRDKC